VTSCALASAKRVKGLSLHRIVYLSDGIPHYHFLKLFTSSLSVTADNAKYRSDVEFALLLWRTKENLLPLRMGEGNVTKPSKGALAFAWGLGRERSSLEPSPLRIGISLVGHPNRTTGMQSHMQFQSLFITNTTRSCPDHLHENGFIE